MRMKSFASLFALAIFCLLPMTTGIVRASETVTAGSIDFAEINITRIKSVLQLTPAQQSYWLPVEAALRDIAREQSDSNSGLVRRISRRVVSIVVNSAAVARLGAAVRPLIGRLDQQQREAALGLAREMGLGPVLAALN